MVRIFDPLFSVTGGNDKVPDTILRLIEASNPTAMAVADEKTALTFDELRRLSGRIAYRIRRQHGAGHFMILHAHTTVDFVATLLGTLYSGNVPMPIAPGSPASFVRSIGERVNTRISLNPFEAHRVDNGEELYAVDRQLPCIVLFTSGTTSVPKGVLISHDNLMHSLPTIAKYLDYRTYPSGAAVLPLYYSYGLLSHVLALLTQGGFVRLFENFRQVLNFVRDVNDLGLKTFCGVPSTFVTLAKVARLKKIEMPCVRVVCSAGAAMDLGMYQAIKALFPNGTLFNNYGLTEAAPRVAYLSEREPRFFSGSCGKPMDGVDVKLIDVETHANVPSGGSGVLAVKGPNITSGYLNDEEQTKAAFTLDGYFISRDLARIEDGFIYILGRSDDVFNVGGEKISPDEIEHCLNQIPAVEASGVTGVPDPLRGQVPAAFLILRNAVSRQSILRQLQGLLRPAAMPVWLYEVSELPTTPNGKIQRNRLRADAGFVLQEIND